MKKISQMITYLNNSPLYAMSLSSKELFHSNFWSWLITTNEIKPQNIFLKVFFEDIDINRDLTIYCDKDAYIIENKIKAIPYPSQLQRYQDELKNYKCGLLTGLIKPDFIDGINSWNFLSYEDISKRIFDILKTVTCSNFVRDLILRYAQMIECISNIVKSFTVANNDTLLNNKDCKILNEIRFADVCLKHNSKNFEYYLKEQIEGRLNILLKDINYKLYIGSDFSRKNSIIDVRLYHDEDKSNGEVIGIQIQGDQYRYLFQKNGDYDNNLIFNRLKELGWFFDISCNDNEKTINNKKTIMRSDNYCKFEGINTYKQKYHFIYQYFIIQNKKFDVLKDEIFNDIVHAINLIKKSDRYLI